MDTNDIDELVSEFAMIPYEQIIQRHFINGSSSGIRIQNLLAVEFYISKYDFASVSNE